MLSKTEIRGGALVLTGVVLGLLLLIWFAPGVPGELLLQTLRFHIIALGAFFALVAIFAGAKRRGAILLIVMIIAAGHSVTYVRDLLGRRPPIYDQPVGEFKMLSFNVLYDNAGPSNLVDSILADAPDVVLVMESPGISMQFDRLKSILPYQVGCVSRDPCDISLHSKYKLENVRLRNLPPFARQRLVAGEITLGGEKVTIVGAHLSKPYFDGASWVELQAIGEFLNTVEGPVILAGDFNSAPWSDPLATMTARQNMAIANWPPATWPVELGAFGVPIDNMFSRGNVRIKTLEAGEPLGSNHRPLKATVSLYKAP